MSSTEQSEKQLSRNLDASGLRQPYSKVVQILVKLGQLVEKRLLEKSQRDHELGGRGGRGPVRRFEERVRTESEESVVGRDPESWFRSSLIVAPVSVKEESPSRLDLPPCGLLPP